MEKWKIIKGYSNYQVSNIGNVRTIDYNHTGKMKNLKIFKNIYGYPACNLMQNGVRQRKLIHRLVAEAFIPNLLNKKTVNHKDGNKKNNVINNLEWMTVSENLKHSHANGLVNYSKGENHYMAKLSTKNILIIKQLLKNNIKGRDIANLFNVDEKLISSIKTGHSRKYENLNHEKNKCDCYSLFCN